MATHKSSCAVDIDDPRYRTTPLQQMAASCTGALLTSLIVTPLDVIKIRLQTQQKVMSSCFLYCNGLMDHLCVCCPAEKSASKAQIKSAWFQRPGHFNGTIDAFIKITRNEGMSSLWSGLSPTLVLAVPATIIYFVSYEQLRLKFKDNYNKHRTEFETLEQPFWIPLVAGATARIFSATLVSPLELIRTKMQSQRLSYLEIGQALKSLVKNNGVVGLWKGLTPTLLRDVPFSAIYWMNYETIKKFFGPGVPSFGFSFIAGAISGSIAATITIPFDVVKTHQQIEFGEQQLNTNKPLDRPKSTYGVMKEIYARQGMRGLFIGLAPRVIKVAPACAIMIATFEHGKVVFNRLANYNTYPSNAGSCTDSNITMSSHTAVKQKDATNIGLVSRDNYV